MSHDVEVTYFRFGLLRQSLLVGRHASQGTEAHPPVAMDAEADFCAAMITAHGDRGKSHGLSFQWLTNCENVSQVE